MEWGAHKVGECRLLPWKQGAQSESEFQGTLPLIWTFDGKHQLFYLLLLLMAYSDLGNNTTRNDNKDNLIISENMQLS